MLSAALTERQKAECAQTVRREREEGAAARAAM